MTVLTGRLHVKSQRRTRRDETSDRQLTELAVSPRKPERGFVQTGARKTSARAENTRLERFKSLRVQFPGGEKREGEDARR